MTKISTKIVFFGNERIATGVKTDAPTLRALLGASYQVCAVVSSTEQARSRNARKLEIEEVAANHNIPFLTPAKPTDVLEQLKSFGAEIGVLVAYGKIIPQGIIDVFPKGIVNIHPSLLPLHRGPTPLESVILSGKTKTGVSIMSISKKMDAGPIFGQSEVKLAGAETKQQLADSLLEIGKAMLLELLPGILQGDIVALPQDESRATYDQLIDKDDGIIDWNKPAIQLERETRAYFGWPKSRTKLAGKDVTITKVHVIDETGMPGKLLVKDKQLIVFCGEKALSIDELIPAGKNKMDTPAFLAGYGSLLV